VHPPGTTLAEMNKSGQPAPRFGKPLAQSTATIVAEVTTTVLGSSSLPGTAASAIDVNNTVTETLRSAGGANARSYHNPFMWTRSRQNPPTMFRRCMHSRSCSRFRRCIHTRSCSRFRRCMHARHRVRRCMRWNLWSRFYAPGLSFLAVQRNTTREKQKAKIVLDAVREHGLVKATGDAELYKMDMFDKYKFLHGEPLSRYVVCQVCFSQGDYDLAQISRGSCGLLETWRDWPAVCCRSLRLQPRLSVSSPQPETR
jgi:hypothetical protein